MKLNATLAGLFAATALMVATLSGVAAPPTVAAISHLGGDVISPTVLAISHLGGDYAPLMIGINRFGAD